MTIPDFNSDLWLPYEINRMDKFKCEKCQNIVLKLKDQLALIEYKKIRKI